MLRHGSSYQPVTNRIKHKHNRATAFEVVRCPGNEFPSGAVFSQIDVRLGLYDECWPQGMQFRRLKGTNVLTVKGQALVNAEGGLCRV